LVISSTCPIIYSRPATLKGEIYFLKFFFLLLWIVFGEIIGMVLYDFDSGAIFIGSNSKIRIFKGRFGSI